MFATYLIFFLAICYAQSDSVSQDVASQRIKSMNNDAALDTNDSISKNYTFNVNEKKFVLMMDQHNFYDALSICESLGLKLVSVETQDDSDVISEILFNLVDLKRGHFWTSGVRLATQDWAWLTAKQYLTYTNWGLGKPDNDGGNENCIKIVKDTTQAVGSWDDEQCDLQNKYICEG